MRRGSVFQRHTRACPRDAAGKVLPHKCRGPWTYSTLLQPHSDGRRRQASRSGFRTKREAELALDEARARDASGVSEIHGMSVAEHLDRWLASKRSIRATTRRNYERDIRKYLTPALGTIPLADLRPHHVDDAYNSLLARAPQPASASLVRHLHSTLRGALNAATKRRLIPWNPALHVELPEHVAATTSVWTPAQLTQFLASTRGHRLHTLFRLIAVTGVRRGEAIALHWDDLDLDHAAFTVRWQLVAATGGAALGPPKTRSGARVVPIDASTVAELRAHRVRQETERQTWGTAWTEHGLVFTREDGTPLRPDYITHLATKLMRRAGVPRIRLHDLRHTNASLALAAGVPIKVVSYRLGHSSTAITSDLYTHVIPSVAHDAAERIAALIDVVTDQPSQGDADPEYCASTAQGTDPKGASER